MLVMHLSDYVILLLLMQHSGCGLFLRSLLPLDFF